MAAIEQGKLNSLCSSISSTAEKYVSDVTNEVNRMKEAFNEAWVSVSAQTLATEISGCLQELVHSVETTFKSKDDAIRMSVNNFNATEQEDINYPGFAFGIPNTEITLNQTLPNGKVGVADGADLTSIEVPMNNLIGAIEGDLDTILNTVKNADAFDVNEQEALSSSITNIKNKFSEAMEELKSSLSNRMSGEISARDSLDQANISNLSI